MSESKPIFIEDPGTEPERLECTPENIRMLTERNGLNYGDQANEMSRGESTRIWASRIHALGKSDDNKYKFNPTINTIQRFADFHNVILEVRPRKRGINS